MLDEVVCDEQEVQLHKGILRRGLFCPTTSNFPSVYIHLSA